MVLDPAIEVLRPDSPRGQFRAALFDWDGTLSLLREGWQRVMSALMREELGGDSEAVVESIVVGMNGRPTIVQMQALAEEVGRRRGRPGDASGYAAQYQERLLAMICDRYEAIRTGAATPADWAVPGAHAFLGCLRERGVALILASGTELAHVRREADMLGLAAHFGEAVFAPYGDDPNFSKRTVIEQVLSEYGLGGGELLGFGDGVVETEEVRRVGGVAVAVASEEPPRHGVNAAKRERLIQAGADFVIGDYRSGQRLLRWLFGEE